MNSKKKIIFYIILVTLFSIIFLQKAKYNEDIMVFNEDNLLQDNSRSIDERINSYLAHIKSNIGFYYYNLATGEEVRINADKYFIGASTYKVGLNLICYDMVQRGKITLEDKVFYNPLQFQYGTGVLQYKSNLVYLDLQTVLDYSIVYSDNIAATMASDYIGGRAAFKEKLYTLIKVKNGKLDNFTTAEIEVEVLKYLYQNRENEYFAYLLEVMTKTEFHDRLDKYLPYEVVAHKIGNYYTAVHDMGIVYAKNPYIVVFLTDNVYDAENIIANISKMLYLYNS